MMTTTKPTYDELQDLFRVEKELTATLTEGGEVTLTEIETPDEPSLVPHLQRETILYVVTYKHAADHAEGGNCPHEHTVCDYKRTGYAGTDYEKALANAKEWRTMFAAKANPISDVTITCTETSEWSIG